MVEFSAFLIHILAKVASETEIKARENSSDARKKILAGTENKIAEIEKQIQGDGKFGVFAAQMYFSILKTNTFLSLSTNRIHHCANLLF